MKKLIPIILLLAISGCQPKAEQQSEDTAADTTTPDSSSDAVEALSEDDYIVALDFLNAYIENCNDLENALSPSDWANTSPLVTENFKTELQNLITEAEEENPELGLDYDPILNAQDYPEDGMELAEFDAPSGYVVARGKNQRGVIIVVKLVKQNGTVLIDGCGVINIPEEM
jgi:hypothetical protein